MKEQTNKQTNKQANTQTNKQTHTHTHTHTHKQTNKKRSCMVSLAAPKTKIHANIIIIVKIPMNKTVPNISVWLLKVADVLSQNTGCLR